MSVYHPGRAARIQAIEEALDELYRNPSFRELVSRTRNDPDVVAYMADRLGDYGGPALKAAATRVSLETERVYLTMNLAAALLKALGGDRKGLADRVKRLWKLNHDGTGAYIRPLSIPQIWSTDLEHGRPRYPAKPPEGPDHPTLASIYVMAAAKAWEEYEARVGMLRSMAEDWLKDETLTYEETEACSTAIGIEAAPGYLVVRHREAFGAQRDWWTRWRKGVSSGEWKAEAQATPDSGKVKAPRVKGDRTVGIGQAMGQITVRLEQAGRRPKQVPLLPASTGGSGAA